ncbi:DUF3616 domain-containing protein [Solirubrobacter phytolaccae]|uniref:DUF3616 domain-containing protein n=1 Tax=Solirubrobacter phytolaccae TaxID=1404360 RepID=A0A9X3SBN9_9ACTN|nr:DUF3616 domain-containing protein [Solirubrobacter phytolaccae]MDA0183801.1 DUF3616 domain-containing protein [Solirubrobacter phytolaccae]
MNNTRRALALALVTLAGAAAPASADPVIAGPATPDELAVLAVGGVNTTHAARRADQVALHRLSTTDGAYKGRILFPSDTLTKSSNSLNAPIRNAGLRRSADGRFLLFNGGRGAAGTSNQDILNATTVRVAADGTWTDQRLGTAYMTTGEGPVGTVSLDGTRKWLGINHNTKPIATIAEGETELTQVGAFPTPTVPVTSIDLVDGSLVVTGITGVSRLPGGLPTAQNTTTPPQEFIAAPIALDATFLDTDGVAGADTAYVVRDGRGVWKFALDAGTWKSRGVVGGSYGYVAARAVAGAIEVYLTTANTAKLVKFVDTAEVGGDVKTTGVSTLAYAPARARYTGLAFTPTGGFPADGTAYPATAPAMTASATTVDTHIGATTKGSVTLEVFDPNSADVTVTATSSNQTILPNDKIAISGTGAVRTATFDPIATGTATVTFTARSGDDAVTATLTLKVSPAVADPGGHYYSGPVDLSAAIDVGGDYFLGISDEVNTVHLFKKGVSGGSLAQWNQGFPGGETDFEGATRFGNTIVWSGSHGNNRSGSARPERRFLAFQTISGSGATVGLEWRNSYTRLWQQWKDWDASNGHGLGANKLKFNTATVPGLLPNAPNGFNVEGLTMAPGSSSVAWFGMRAPTITGADGIERAVILPVNNLDKLTSDSVNAEFGAPIFLDLGGRSIRDISKNAKDQYLISAGTGDTDDSLKNWALYTWDGNVDHQPQMVKELPTDEARIGAWEGIAELPTDLVAGSRVLMLADSGDTGLGKSYGQYVTIGEPIAGPAAVTGITATGKPGALDASWNAADRATQYYVTVKTAAGAHAPGSPKFVTGTSASFEGLTAGTEYTVQVRPQNVATRAVPGTPATATPTQGARVATTTTLEFQGSNILGEVQKLVATVSDPNARGTIQFFGSGQRLQDSFATGFDPSVGANVYTHTFPVVNGKAVIDITDARGAGMTDLQAKFTTANAENYLSSESAVAPTLFEYRPKQPWAEIVSITGDRVVGSRIAITVKLGGYKPSELWREVIRTEFNTRLNGAVNRTRLVGDTQETSSGYAALNEDGLATIYTTALAAGDHRISVQVPGYSTGYVTQWTDEIPVTIAPAGSPAPEVKPIKRPAIAVKLSGPGVTRTGQALTLTAKLSDPTLTGTVTFFNYSTALGTAVPVVNGVATTSVTNTSPQLGIYARFDPVVAERTTTAGATSQAVPLLRAATDLPRSGTVATKTTLAVSGSTGTVTVSPVGGDAFAIRDVYGYAEILEGERVVGFAPTRVGVATIDLSSLGAGPHTLRARYVSSDETRSLSSEIVQTDAPAPVGGSVPATLSLTLGAPATFGAFTPGVEREYTATTKATVISTAGDAALSVSEPGHLTNGAFSLPQPLRVELGRSAWSGPTANEDVPVTFKQAIGANDALRTGAYSKTLTFTLSTTQP